MINRFQFDNFFLSLCRLRRFPSLFYAPLALSACDVGLWDCDKWQLISCHFLRVSRPCLPKQIQFHLFKVFFPFSSIATFSHSCLRYMIKCYECKFHEIQQHSYKQIAFLLILFFRAFSVQKIVFFWVFWGWFGGHVGYDGWWANLKRFLFRKYVVARSFKVWNEQLLKLSYL